jgi:hypothetical protein
VLGSDGRGGASRTLLADRDIRENWTRTGGNGSITAIVAGRDYAILILVL